MKVLKLVGTSLLLVFCVAVIVRVVLTFLLPPWASAEVFGFDLGRFLEGAVAYKGLVWSYGEAQGPNFGTNW